MSVLPPTSLGDDGVSWRLMAYGVLGIDSSIDRQRCSRHGCGHRGGRWPIDKVLAQSAPMGERTHLESTSGWLDRRELRTTRRAKGVSRRRAPRRQRACEAVGRGRDDERNSSIGMCGTLALVSQGLLPRSLLAPHSRHMQRTCCRAGRCWQSAGESAKTAAAARPTGWSSRGTRSIAAGWRVTAGSWTTARSRTGSASAAPSSCRGSPESGPKSLHRRCRRGGGIRLACARQHRERLHGTYGCERASASPARRGCQEPRGWCPRACCA